MEYKSGVLFVRLIGSLNKLTSNKLLETLIPIITRQGIRYLVYNFNELDKDVINKIIFDMNIVCGIIGIAPVPAY